MNPGKKNRVPEAFRHGEFFSRTGIPLLGEIRRTGYDRSRRHGLIDDHTLLIGHGYRTNTAGIDQMRNLPRPDRVEVSTAPLPYGADPRECLHLMSLISLLDEKTALVDLPWLAVETVELLKRRGYQFIEIDAAERNTLGCNVLSLGQGRLVAIEENRDTNQRLRDASFKVFTFLARDQHQRSGRADVPDAAPVSRAVDKRLLAAKTAKNNRQGRRRGTDCLAQS